jgi:hypothetical protein
MTYESNRLIVLGHSAIKSYSSATPNNLTDDLRKIRIYSLETKDPRSTLKQIPTGRLRAADFSACHWVGRGKKREIKFKI